MPTDPPVLCRQCTRFTCATTGEPCLAMNKWLDETYRDHYSVDTPEEHRWPVVFDVSPEAIAIAKGRMGVQ